MPSGKAARVTSATAVVLRPKPCRETNRGMNSAKRMNNTAGWQTGGFIHGAEMFDQIDRKIIDLLQQKADMSVVEIASAVGISHTPCWRRIKRMEDMGL